MAKRTEEAPPSVVLGFVADTLVETDFVTSLLNVTAVRHDQIKGRVITTQGYAGRLDIGRHIIASAFLNSTDADYLVMVDSDVVFTLKDYDELLRSAVDAVVPSIISGLYARHDGSFCVFDLIDNGDEDVWTPVGGEELSHNRFYEAAGVGMGFVCIPRSVLEKIAEGHEDRPLPWFDNTAKGPGRMADDTSFCWRATSSGIKIFVNTQVQVGHLKTVAMYPKLDPTLMVAEKKLIVPGQP